MFGAVSGRNGLFGERESDVLSSNMARFEKVGGKASNIEDGEEGCVRLGVVAPLTEVGLRVEVRSGWESGEKGVVTSRM